MKKFVLGFLIIASVFVLSACETFPWLTKAVTTIVTTLTTATTTTNTPTTPITTTTSPQTNALFDEIDFTFAEGDLAESISLNFRVPLSIDGHPISWSSNNSAIVVNTTTGVAKVTQQSTITAVTLTASIGSAPTVITQDFLFSVLAATTPDVVDYANDLMISEYIEGSSNNKYLEIFNGTGSAVDLSSYSLELYANNALTANSTLALSGSLPHGSTKVIANSSAVIFSGEKTISSVTQFNGDDAVVLKHGSDTIDIIGVIGSAILHSAGIEGVGQNIVASATQNYTLVRSASIKNPNATFTGSEWIVYPIDTATDLGKHEMADIEIVDDTLTRKLNQILENIQFNFSGTDSFGNVTQMFNVPMDDIYYEATLNWSALSEYISLNSQTGNVVPIPSGVDQDATIILTISLSGKTLSQTYHLTVSGTGTVDPVDTDYPSLAQNPANVYINYIDIGRGGAGTDQGEASYIKIGDLDILLDSGSNQALTYTNIKYVLNQYMTDTVFEYAIFSHNHSDHVGGSGLVLQDYSFEYVIYPLNSSIRGTDQSCSSTDVVGDLNGCHKTYQLAPDISLQFFDSNSLMDSSNANYSSQIALFTIYGKKFLFAGDAERNQEEVYAPLVGDIDVFKMSHHGTRNGNTVNLMNTVKPEVIVIMNGNKLANANGHPTDTAINNVYKTLANASIYATTGGGFKNCNYGATQNFTCSSTVADNLTDRNGTIKITINSSGYSVSSELAGNNPIELSTTKFWLAHNKSGVTYYSKGKVLRGAAIVYTACVTVRKKENFI